LKGPDVVLDQEQELASSLRYSANRLQAEIATRLPLSYEKAWGPRLIERATALAVSGHGARSWSRAIGRTIDSSLASARNESAEAGLAAHVADLTRSAAAAIASDRDLRAEIVRT